MKMKIVLINPPWYSPVPQKFQTPNLGLSYLTSFVRERGHTVVPIDALFDTSETPVEVVPVKFKYQGVYRVGISYKDIVKQIPKDAGLVGIAGPTSNHERIIRELSAAIKKKYPEMKILVGGPYVSARPESFPSLSVDFGIDGEPEIVLDKFLSGEPYSKIKGVIYKERGKWHFNGKADPPVNLDSIPFPAREVFHCNEILDRQVGHKREGTKIIKNKARGVLMTTSRGCPYSCEFCSIGLMNGKKWRGRSPENVIKEMIELRDRYNIAEIAIIDDHLAGDRERLMKIMNLMIKKKVGLEWSLPNGIRVDYLDDELLQKMKESGCNSVVLGIQHGTQKMLDIMKTDLKLDKVEKVVKSAHKLGLNLAAYIIVAYPGETRELFMESIRFCRRLGRRYGITDWRINIARAYPKTAFDRLCREKGYYVRRDVENMLYFPGDDTEANIKTPEFDPAQAIWRRNYAKGKLIAAENPLYWNLVYYMERLKIKGIIRKIMPVGLWDLQKRMVFKLLKKIAP